MLHGLRLELKTLLKKIQDNSSLFASAGGWLNELSEGLAEEPLRFQSFAGPGRKLGESAVRFFMERCQVTSNADQYGKIRALYDSKKVAPWLKNYLLALKDYGNEQVHDDTATYKPTTVSHNDLLTLLCSISGVLRLWLGWDDLS